MFSARLDALRPIENDWFAGVSFGINYADRSKEKEIPETGLGTIGGVYYQIDERYLLSPMNLNYADAGRALAWDVMGVLAEYYNPVVPRGPTTGAPQ